METKQNIASGTETLEKPHDGNRKVQPLVRRVWFNMVKTPTGWMRVGNAFGSKEAAEEMLDVIVRGYYEGRETKAEPLDLNYVDGRLDEQTVRILDEKFNLDAA